MAKKRALVDAVVTTTAASDIFTQDLEDLNASLAMLAPASPAPAAPAPVQATVIDVPAELVPSTATAAPVASTMAADPAATEASLIDGAPTERLDFRHVTVHFGKNRGMTLADLTPQQLHWYEAEWMPKKEAAGAGDDGDRTLIAGLKAYRQWREAEKTTQAPPPRRRARDRRAGRPVPVEAAA